MTTLLATFSRGACAALLWSALAACAAPISAPASGASAPLALEADFAKADSTHAVVTDTLDLGAGLRLPARIETTTQGNGTLSIGNLTLRLKDKHDDGLVYAGSGVLRLDVVALSPGRHPSALIVSGTALHTGEKESDPSVPEAVVYIYEVDCAAGRLVRTWRNTSVDIELDTSSGGAVRCAK
jgi:hypothetical protein